MSTTSLPRRCVAEAIGTLMLVFIGCGSVASNIASAGDGGEGALGLVGISMAFGLVVTAVVYSLGSISGAHINPAVTFTLLVQRRFPALDAVAYVVAQVAGAIAAAALLKVIYPSVTNLGVTNPISADTIWQAFAIEVVLTFILIYVILHVTSGSEAAGTLAGVVIGGTVTMNILVGGPISGASMNPARSIGPALLSGDLNHLWIYITAPLVGSLIAVLCFTVTRGGFVASDDSTAGKKES